MQVEGWIGRVVIGEWSMMIFDDGLFDRSEVGDDDDRVRKEAVDVI